MYAITISFGAVAGQVGLPHLQRLEGDSNVSISRMLSGIACMLSDSLAMVSSAILETFTGTTVAT